MLRYLSIVIVLQLIISCSNNNLSDQVKVMNHWSRTNLLKTFNPKDSTWQNKLIERGLTVFKISERYLKNL